MTTIQLEPQKYIRISIGKIPLNEILKLKLGSVVQLLIEAEVTKEEKTPTFNEDEPEITYVVKGIQVFSVNGEEPK